MKILKHVGFSNKLLVLLATLIHAGSLFAATGYESISSDQPEYMPGDTATISGVGFEPNHAIEVQVIRADGSIVTGNGTETPGSDTVTTDATGHFAYSYLLAGGDRSVYNGILTTNAIDPDSSATLATTTFIDGDEFVVQGCDSNGHNDHCNPDTVATGWAGGSYPINGWTSGELQGWQPLDNVPFRVRLDLKNAQAGIVNITTIQDYSTSVGGATVLAIDSASDFYVGVGPGGSGTEGDLSKSCVLGAAGDLPTTGTPCIVSGPTYSGGDPNEIQYSWSILFDSAEVGGDNSKWGLYWLAHLNGGANTFPGPNGKIYTTTSQTQNHTVDVKLASDDDHDGVTNDDDHCGSTPDGEEVDHHHGDEHEGCGYSDFDYDHDGVNNAHDLCPGTASGASVDADGCSAEQLGPYTLTISTAGTGSGTTSGAGSYNYGQTASVSASAATGSSFGGWSGADATDCANGSVVMTTNKSCTATFTLNTYTMTLSAAGSGFGTVSGGGTYNYGDTATVTAVASPGSSFAGWSGPDGAVCSGGSVLIDADKSCTATFTLNSYTLMLTTTGTGSGTVSGAGDYSYGDTATVTATPSAGSTFEGWTGPDGVECSGGTVSMDASKSCTATFTLDTHTLTITSTGTGSGTLSGGGNYSYGDTATVTAMAHTGSTFSGWSGPDATECAAGSVVMDADKSCTATFTLNSYTMTVDMAGTGSGTVGGAGDYSYGDTTTVTATPSTGSTFDGWTGPDAAECATGAVLMDADKSCTANFTVASYTLSIDTAGTGSGTVSGDGNYNYGDTATVTATPSTGSTFDGWTGPDAAECGSGSVAMTADKSCTATFTATVASNAPDLIVKVVSFGNISITRNAGTNFMITDTVKNVGDTKATRFVIAYHLSTDTVYGNEDDIVSKTKRNVSSLLPGATNTWPSTSVVIPSDTPPGVYHLCEKADDDVTGTYSVTETNEDNNWKCTGPTITVPKPDLVMKQVSIFANTVTAGDSMVILDSHSNEGGSQALAYDVGFVLSRDGVIGLSSDILLPTTRTLEVLGVGATSTASTTVTIPADVPPGDYYVGAIADVNGTVAELNEGNNAGKATIITVVAPQ